MKLFPFNKALSTYCFLMAKRIANKWNNLEVLEAKMALLNINKQQDPRITF
jgi:hypothetical protein